MFKRFGRVGVQDAKQKQKRSERKDTHGMGLPIMAHVVEGVLLCKCSSFKVLARGILMERSAVTHVVVLIYSADSVARNVYMKYFQRSKLQKTRFDKAGAGSCGRARIGLGGAKNGLLLCKRPSVHESGQWLAHASRHDA